MFCHQMNMKNFSVHCPYVQNCGWSIEYVGQEHRPLVCSSGDQAETLLYARIWSFQNCTPQKIKEKSESMCPRLKLEERDWHNKSFKANLLGYFRPLSVDCVSFRHIQGTGLPSLRSEFRWELSLALPVPKVSWRAGLLLVSFQHFPPSHKGLFKAQFLISYLDPFLEAKIKKIRGSRTGYVSVMLTKLQGCSQLLYRKILTTLNHRKSSQGGSGLLLLYSDTRKILPGVTKEIIPSIPMFAEPMPKEQITLPFLSKLWILY